MNHMQRLMATLVMSALPMPALADTVGVYQMKDKAGKDKRTMSVSYKSDQAIRMDVAEGQYMLVTGSKVYMVSLRKGKWTAMDMDSMPKFNMPVGNKTEKSGGKVTKTGRTETIAGVKGDVWEITTEEGEKHEMVVSSDSRAKGLSRAFAAMAMKMGQGMGSGMSAQINAAMKESSKTGGLLRVDQHMVLASLEDKSQPAGYYQLPAGTEMQQMPKMDPAMMQKMQEMMQRKQQP